MMFPQCAPYGRIVLCCGRERRPVTRWLVSTDSALHTHKALRDVGADETN